MRSLNCIYFSKILVLAWIQLSLSQRRNDIIDEVNWRELEEHQRRISSSSSSRALRHASLTEELWGEFVDGLKISASPHDRHLHAALINEHISQPDEEKAIPFSGSRVLRSRAVATRSDDVIKYIYYTNVVYLITVVC